jgi:hypothetical protein
MAIVRNNPLLKGISGSIGKRITFRQLGGQTVMSKYRGPSSVPPTDAQLSVRGRFAKAVAYARKAKKDEILVPLYQAAASAGHSAYHLALRDALSAPIISQIICNHHTGAITISATDIIQVHTVTLSICNAEGILLEEGPASRQAGTDEWTYSLSKTQSLQYGNVITAVACDYPGNCTLFSVSLKQYISPVNKAIAAKGCNKQETITAKSKFYLPFGLINYIEKKAREPDPIIKSQKNLFISRIKDGLPSANRWDPHNCIAYL